MGFETNTIIIQARTEPYYNKRNLEATANIGYEILKESPFINAYTYRRRK